MSDLNVDRWKQIGNLYLWHYTENTKNYPDWHLSADVECCESLVDLFGKMLESQWNSQKSLSITPPTWKVLRFPNNRKGLAKWKSPANLKLKHLKDVNDEYSEVIEAENSLVITVGSQKLQIVKECVQKIPTGEGDYSIEVGKKRLWFW